MMSNNTSGATSEGGAPGPRGTGGSSQSMKKGPWTSTEDAILTDYVKKHGEGNWNAVQRNSGLMRCGKSCRLRWANHLRPNLKKGAFSPEEERIIIELHAKLGNKWARMAAQLPGRTDNEIKNYWNTRLKRRQRAGLPIYPQEIQEEAAAFHLEQEQEQQQQLKRHHSSSSSLSSLLSSSQPQKRTYNPSLSLYDTFSFSTATNSLQNQPTSFYSDPNHQFKLFGDNNNNNNNGSPYFPPLSPVSPYRPSSSSLYNQNLTALPSPSPSFQFSTSPTFERNLSFSSLLMGAPVSPTAFVPKLKTELPLSQTPPPPLTPVSSGSSDGVCVMAAPSKTNNNCEITPKLPRNNSGLLDDLVQESHSLSRNEKSKDENLSSVVVDKGKGVVEFSTDEEKGNERVESMLRNSGGVNAQNQWEDLNSSPSSIGMKKSEEHLEEMNSMDDELVSLLTNFPSSMPVPLPEWYPRTSNTSNGSSSNVTGGNEGPNTLNTQQNASSTPVATTAGLDIDWALNSGYWNNMPGIC